MQQRVMNISGPEINQFNNISPNAIPRSSFVRNFTRRTTFNSDFLIPIFVDEILPGDDVHVKMSAVTRMSTPIKPLMDNLYQDFFFFYIPNRLVWDKWEQFQGMRLDPMVSTDYTIPVLDNTKAPLSTTGFLNESIYDYFGLPTLVDGLEDISCLFNRAYLLTWNEWFRDENLQADLITGSPNFKGDGPDDPGAYGLLRRNKRKDYLTSCLPWPQKGDASGFALAGQAPLVFTGGAQGSIPALSLNADRTYVQGDATPRTQVKRTSALDALVQIPGSTNTAQANISFTNSTPIIVDLDNPGDSYADLSAVSTVTINALRQAALYQQILELDARGGTRYVEAIYSRFGVVNPDFRLQRPELIGQSSSRINVYAVPQTQSTDSGTTPQGNLAAFAQNTMSQEHGCRYSATEHGMIIGLMNVRADLTYQQGIPRMFTRQTRLDFYEPLQNGLGEQAVLNREIFAAGEAADLNVFGYQERWSEYRFKQSEITGKFRSNDPQTLDIWHVSQYFGTRPNLNGLFIEEHVPMDRVLAVTDEPQFLMDMAFQYNHVRPMPIRSNPGITRL